MHPTQTASGPQWSPVDDGTASLLDLLAADWTPFAEDDRNEIARVIREDALANGGYVDPNRVRRQLAGRVKPQRVGSTYRLLTLQGVLRVDAWVISDDTKGGNAGKPSRTYKWIGGAA